MHHLVSNHRRSTTLRTPSRVPSVTLLLLLAALAACEGDLDPRYGRSPTTGSGGSSLPGSGGSTGSGGAPAAGTGGMTTGGGTGGMVAASACTFTQTVIPTKCGVPGCHASGFPPELSSDAMAAMAVNAPRAATCAGDPMAMYLINPAAPVAGILIDRITGTLCGATSQMPLGGASLTQTEVDCIKSYFMSKIH